MRIGKHAGRCANEGVVLLAAQTAIVGDVQRCGTDIIHAVWCFGGTATDFAGLVKYGADLYEEANKTEIIGNLMFYDIFYHEPLAIAHALETESCANRIRARCNRSN